jgi:tetratricopeptide (TPR) repeat protein
MKKTVLTALALVFISGAVFAQSLQDGVKQIYYRKLKTATDILQKVVSNNPKDAQAIYWLGMISLVKDDVPGAKALFQKALNDGINDPWIWVGLGHVQLLENDINGAKQKFEQAITASKTKKGENPDILNAIARANAGGSSQVGDPQYGVEVAKRAAAIDQKNPDILINEGVNYLKMGSDKGGEAVEAFTQAITENPKYAEAYFRIGNIYKSQNNLESMNEWYGKAIAADPAFDPVYLAYFDYYKERDVNLAKEYLDKWIANSDQDCTTDYFVADYLFRAGKYQESLEKAKHIETTNCDDAPRINVLYAYNHDRLGDSVQAKKDISTFFAEEVIGKIQPDDYVFAGKLYAKFPGLEDTAAAYLDKAIKADTIKANQIKYADLAASIMGKAHKYGQQMYWMNRSVTIKGGKMEEHDFYVLNKTLTDAIVPTLDSVSLTKLYMTQDSVAKAYIAAYPDKPQGYMFRMIGAKKADVDTSKGLAIEPIAQYNQFLLKDTSASNKQMVVANDYYLLTYYTQKVKPRIEGYKKAVVLLDEMLPLMDPASDSYKSMAAARTQLDNAVKKFESQKSAAGKSK